MAQKITATPIFDVDKAKLAVEKGRRSKWWQRQGSSPKRLKYFDAGGKRITNKETLERIRLLVIPPAWQHVRINPSQSGRIQAIGMDGTGRVQYIYNPAFAAKKSREKFVKIEKFGEFLPNLRKLTNEHIALDGLPREKVLAVVMRLINSLYFRVGTDLSATHYKTYGITTLQKRHLTVGKKGQLLFDFVGKSHIQHKKVMVDEELATILKDLQNLKPGRKLFRYLDETGKPRAVTPSQINSYLKEATAPEFTAKDFRTWGASVLAAAAFADAGLAETESEKKKTIVRVIKTVAEELGNTPAVCRSSYIHPTILSAYNAGKIAEIKTKRKSPIKKCTPALEPEEEGFLKLLTG